jgi:hypothetical protein
MTLRDYFAAAALQAIMNTGGAQHPDLTVEDATAKAAFEFADAMLKARKL